MTVGQMIEELQKYPAKMPLACSNCDQFAREFNIAERNGYVDLTYDAPPISEEMLNAQKKVTRKRCNKPA